MKKIICLLLVVMISGILAGCQNSNPSSQSSAKSGNKDTNTTTSETGAVVPVDDPLAKYEDTVTLTSYFEISPTIMNIFSQEEIQNCYYTQQQEEQLNIKINYLWYAADTAEDAEQKKNVAIASGEIPDFMLVDSAQLSLLAKSDMINTDIGTIFEQYASDTFKYWTTAEGDAALQSATYGGKVIAIPITGSSTDATPFLWIRKDWLDKLGLEIPTNMDELYNVMVAFKEQDPDGNGKDDTVGMILHKNLLTMATGDAIGLFNSFGAYPTRWVEDGDGQLIYGSVAPQVKDALSFLAKLYSEGLIEKDFSVKDDSKATELAAAGTAGIQYGANWNAMWPLNMTAENDPEADWIALPILSSTDEPAKAQAKLTVNNYVVVSKECEHPEAVIKLMNFYCKVRSDLPMDEYNKYMTIDAAGELTFPLHYIMLKPGNPNANQDAYLKVKEALANNDATDLNAEELGYYNDILAYKDGDLSKLGTLKTFGPENSAFAAMNEYRDNDRFMMDKFNGSNTPTMTQKISLINDKVIEYYTRVIMGIDTVDTFESFVDEVNQLGLTEITSEVNEWYTSKQ